MHTTMLVLLALAVGQTDEEVAAHDAVVTTTPSAQQDGVAPTDADASVAVAAPEVPAVRPATPAVPVTPAAAPRAYGKTNGLIPGIVIGPKIALRLPTPAFGVELKTLNNLLGASFDYGFIPTLTRNGDSSDTESVKATDWNVSAKVYPLRAAFFLGGAFGKRTVSASQVKPDLMSGGGSVRVDVAYLAPSLGWHWTWGSGFFLGTELSWQFALKSTTTYGAGTSESFKSDLEDAVKIASGGLPCVGLLQIGFFL